MSSSRMSIEGLVQSLGSEFKAWCPKCKSTNIHLMGVTGAWSGRADYSFSCYTCGLRRYGDEPVYNLILDLANEWKAKSAEREAEKARRAEEVAQKARILDAIEKHKAEQRARDEEARRRADEEERRQHREWLERTKRVRAEGPNSGLFVAPPPPPPEPPKPVETPQPPVKVLTAKERKRDREAIYRMKNRERRREVERAYRERRRAKANPKEPIPIPPEIPGESVEDRSKRLKRERDARYRAAKRAKKADPTPRSKPPKKTAPRVNKCAWQPCPNDAREGSKYCSRNCSNKNARSRSKGRKR